MECERIALDACPHCINGCASHPNAAGHRCDTAGCALEGYPVPYNGLAERQQVMWPKELLACVDALRWLRNDEWRMSPSWGDSSERYDLIERVDAALSAWDAVLESPEIYPGRESLPAAGSPPASTTPPAPEDSHAGGGAPTERGHRYPGAPNHTSDCANGCGAWAGPFRSGAPAGVDPFGECPKATPAVLPQPLLPDYVKPLRALSRDVLGRDVLEEK